MKCTGFSHDFANAAKAYDSDKLIDTKQKLIEHWNEVHIAITKRLRRDAEGHKQS